MTVIAERFYSFFDTVLGSMLLMQTVVGKVDYCCSLWLAYFSGIALFWVPKLELMGIAAPYGHS